MEIVKLAEVYGGRYGLARVKPQVIALLRRDGVAERLGEDKVFSDIYQAVEDKIPE